MHKLVGNTLEKVKAKRNGKEGKKGVGGLDLQRHVDTNLPMTMFTASFIRDPLPMSPRKKEALPTKVKSLSLISLKRASSPAQIITKEPASAGPESSCE